MASSFRTLILGLALLIAPALLRADPPGKAPEGTPERAWVDKYGDALPVAALFRLGTLRFRAPEPIYTAALSLDGQTVAVAIRDALLLFDAVTGKLKTRSTLAHADAVPYGYPEIFTVDGRRFVRGLSKGKLEVVDTATGKALTHIDLPKSIGERPRWVVSADGSVLAAAYQIDGSRTEVGAWELGTGKLLARFDTFPMFALSADGKYIAAWSDSYDKNRGQVDIWNVHSGKRVTQLQAPVGRVDDVAFSPTRQGLVVIRQESVFTLCEVATGKELRRWAGAIPGYTTASFPVMRFSPDGSRFVFIDSLGAAQLWDTADFRRLGYFPGVDGDFRAVAFLPGRKLRLCALREHAFVVWDLPGGKRYGLLPEHEGAVGSLAFSGGKLVTAASGRDSIRYWDP